MNSKTAKLIARAARGSRRRREALMAKWRAATPRERGKLRKQLRELAPRRGGKPVRVIPEGWSAEPTPGERGRFVLDEMRQAFEDTRSDPLADAARLE